MRNDREDWSDMSKYVVHFTKGGSDDDDYNAMMGIWGNEVLVPASRFGIGRRTAPTGTEQEAVCFSEIPPGQWDRLFERRGTKYGLAFTKQFILSRGGGPFWYVWRNTPHWKTLRNMMRAAKEKADAPIWNLTPLIDAPGEYRDRDYLFDWEREWRHVGPMGFEPDDVAFLLIPEEHHSDACSFFENARSENIGPAYFCPYIDPSWDRDRILKELRR